MLSNASSELVFRAGNVARALEVRRHPTARGLRLSVDPLDGRVRLTLPKREPLGPALAWAAGKQAWVEARLAAVPAGRPLASGASIPIDGIDRLIVHDPAAARGVRLDAAAIHVGGPPDRVAGRLARWLVKEAHRRLTAETLTMAARAAVDVVSVQVGDPRARWGSCTGSGAIRYSWRLLLAPPAVRESVVAHEIAHRVHMNHSPAFHRAVAELLGREPKAERAWLRANHAAVHAIALPVRNGRGGTPRPPA